MRHYHHLTPFEREKILFLWASGEFISQIADKLCRNKSTISRELRRNSLAKGKMEYSPIIAQKKYEKRRKSCRKIRKMEIPSDLREFVYRCIVLQHWSPEEIAGRLKLEHGETVISYNTIYRAIRSKDLCAIDNDGQKQSIVRKLRHHGKKRHKKGQEERRGKFPKCTDISKRSPGAKNRSRKGHFEADTVVGKKGKACLVTVVDRKTRYTFAGKASSQKVEPVSNTMVRIMQGQTLHSITPDRGREFVQFKKVSAQLDDVKFFFPPPHTPWNRGTNENTNGLLREYFPKRSDFSDISEEYIQQKVNQLNLRPRKCLGYRTPYEAYFSKVLHLA
jgi:IS30 family transposase